MIFLLVKYDLVELIKTNDLIFKLGQQILTVSSRTSSVKRSFSALKRFESYRRSGLKKNKRLSSLSMSIEKVLLGTKKIIIPNFMEKIINEFRETTKTNGFYL